MTPETKWEQIRGALIAMVLTFFALPVIGLWAIVGGICKWIGRHKL